MFKRERQRTFTVSYTHLEVSDVDMDEIPDLMRKIHDTHGIEFLDYDISFKGICPKCRKEAKVE